MSYEDYAAQAPPGKLDLVVDADDVELHLSKIVDELDNDALVNDIAPEMGLKRSEVEDVLRKYRDEPKSQRLAKREDMSLASAMYFFH